MITYNLASDISTLVAVNREISSNTTTNGAIIDIMGNMNGPVFTSQAIAYTDGSYQFKIFESDDSAMADATEVIPDQIVGDLADLSITSGPATEGSVIKRVGVFDTKRYVRLSVVSTDVTDGATIISNVIQTPKIVPSEV